MRISLVLAACCLLLLATLHVVSEHVVAKPAPRPQTTLLAHACCVLDEEERKTAGFKLSCDKWLCAEHYDPQNNLGMLLSDGTYLQIPLPKGPNDEKGSPIKPMKPLYIPQLSIKQAKQIHQHVKKNWARTTVQQDHEIMHIKGEGKFDIRLGWNKQPVKPTSEKDTLDELKKLKDTIKSMVLEEQTERQAFLTKGTIPSSSQSKQWNWIPFKLNQQTYKAQCSTTSEQCTPFEFYETKLQEAIKTLETPNIKSNLEGSMDKSTNLKQTVLPSSKTGKGGGEVGGGVGLGQQRFPAAAAAALLQQEQSIQSHTTSSY